MYKKLMGRSKVWKFLIFFFSDIDAKNVGLHKTLKPISIEGTIETQDKVLPYPLDS